VTHIKNTKFPAFVAAQQAIVRGPQVENRWFRVRLSAVAVV